MGVSEAAQKHQQQLCHTALTQSMDCPGSVLSEQRFFHGLSLTQEREHTLQKAHFDVGATVGPDLSIPHTAL